jgi:hypothetical protein
MAQRDRSDFDGSPPDVAAAERDEAARTLGSGDAVRLSAAGRIVLCWSLSDVETAQRGRIPRSARRLDRGVTR